jgi:hypothetical protein
MRLQRIFIVSVGMSFFATVLKAALPCAETGLSSQQLEI